jgi:hypothetical protein
MRTTLDIDDDVLFAAKELAAKERKTAGKILSEFFRRAHQSGSQSEGTQEPPEPYIIKNGIPVLPSRGEIVSLEQVQRIMDQEGI